MAAASSSAQERAASRSGGCTIKRQSEKLRRYDHEYFIAGCGVLSHGRLQSRRKVAKMVGVGADPLAKARLRRDPPKY